MKKEKIIFKNNIIDLAQPRLGSKIVYCTDDFLQKPLELSVLILQFLFPINLIKTENGWMDGKVEEKEQKEMII